MEKITWNLVFLVLSFSTMNYAQERMSEKSTIVLSEGDIKSLSHKLRKYKRSKKKKSTIQSLNRPITTSDYDSNFESKYLRQEIRKLEEILMQDIENRQTNNSLSTTGIQSSQISNLELKRLRDKIKQLERSLIQEQVKRKSNSDTLASRYRDMSQMRNDITELKTNNNSSEKTSDQYLKISNLESKRLKDKIELLERSLNKETKSKINRDILVSRDRGMAQMRNDINELKTNNHSLEKTSDQYLKISNLESKRLKDKIEQLERSLNKGTKSKINRDILVSRDRDMSQMRNDITELKINKNRSRDRNKTNIAATPIPTDGNQGKNHVQAMQIDAAFITEFRNLKNKIDSLYSFEKSKKQLVNAIPQAEINTHDDAALEEVKRLLAEFKNEQAFVKTDLSEYDALSIKFKNYHQTIYFRNNASSINSDGAQVTEELYRLLNEYNNLDVIVKGFASNKGNAAYNKKLSMQRTESIKSSLVQRGVHPTRILTQYHGIDYQSTSAGNARRVEITILVRK